MRKGSKIVVYDYPSITIAKILSVHKAKDTKESYAIVQEQGSYVSTMVWKRQLLTLKQYKNRTA